MALLVILLVALPTPGCSGAATVPRSGRVVLGGTFDRLDVGHEALLETAFRAAGRSRSDSQRTGISRVTRSPAWLGSERTALAAPPSAAGSRRGILLEDGESPLSTTPTGGRWGRESKRSSSRPTRSPEDVPSTLSDAVADGARSPSSSFPSSSPTTFVP